MMAEPIALEKPIQQDLPFKPNFIEFLFINGERLIRHRESNSTGDLFQVPEGKVLYLFSASISLGVDNPAGNATKSSIVIRTGTTSITETILSCRTVNATTAEFNVATSNSFPVPIKVFSDERVVHTIDTSSSISRASAEFYGVLLDKRIADLGFKL